ncbi:ATP-binding cassette domain-containing protein [Nocardioides insulae]|uniref:ATP-binding cassette domain-containing protein n=1 Tax=Nocardioides insulae TaxID=394734 RepID=UPI0009FFFD9D|nr:ATP-binding cassette domain-containing protein [Nocardioides insulae]
MIRAEGLVKRYRGVTALAGLDLEVEAGTVMALLGPNGAGKTTAVRAITTLLVPDEGRAWVSGVDVLADPMGARARLGLSGQYAAVDEQLSGYENLVMVGRLYHLGRRRSQARARELLDRFDLADAADRPTKTYSGGMRRRLDLAAALVAEPPVLVLDEPTTGLDVRSRAQMWEVIRDLVGSGSTLLLTTQYLEEADRLADEILVIDQGREIARGTADELKSRTGGERIEVVLAEPHRLEDARRELARVALDQVEVGESGRDLSAAVATGAAELRDLLAAYDEKGIKVLDIGLRRPTLDDVFLTLTGHRTESRPGDSGPSGPDAVPLDPAVHDEMEARR